MKIVIAIILIEVRLRMFFSFLFTYLNIAVGFLKSLCVTYLTREMEKKCYFHFGEKISMFSRVKGGTRCYRSQLIR